MHFNYLNILLNAPAVSTNSKVLLSILSILEIPPLLLVTSRPASDFCIGVNNGLLSLRMVLACPVCLKPRSSLFRVSSPFTLLCQGQTPALRV